MFYFRKLNFTWIWTSTHRDKKVKNKSMASFFNFTYGQYSITIFKIFEHLIIKILRTLDLKYKIRNNLVFRIFATISVEEDRFHYMTDYTHDFHFFFPNHMKSFAFLVKKWIIIQTKNTHLTQILTFKILTFSNFQFDFADQWITQLPLQIVLVLVHWISYIDFLLMLTE